MPKSDFEKAIGGFARAGEKRAVQLARAKPKAKAKARPVSQEQVSRAAAQAVKRTGVAVKPLAGGPSAEQRRVNRAAARAVKRVERGVAGPLDSRSPAKKALDAGADVGRRLEGNKKVSLVQKASMRLPKPGDNSLVAAFRLGGVDPMKVVENAPADAADQATGLPAGMYELGKTAVNDPGKLPGMLAAPYKEFGSDPSKFVEDKPVSTFLMFAPGGKALSLRAGKVATKAGKQATVSEARVVPGTAFKRVEKHPTGIVANRRAVKRDRKRAAEGNGKIVATDNEIMSSVDEFAALARKNAAAETQRIAAEAKRAGKTPDEIEAIVTQARKDLKAKAEAEFAERFGASVRLSDGGSETRLATKAARDQAEGAVGPAKTRVARARENVQTARKGAARGRRERGLETKLATREGRVIPATDGVYMTAAARSAERSLRAARTNLVRVQRQQRKAAEKVRHAKTDAARAAARAERDRLAAELKDARAAVRGAERRVETSNAARRGVPEGDAQVLSAAQRELLDARQALDDAYKGRAEAQRADKATKRASSTASLVDDAGRGRVFQTSAEARWVAEKLPFEAAVRRAGDGFVVLPKVAAEQFGNHRWVGTARAPGAIGLRALSGALSKTVLPFSPTYHAGNAIEGGLRTVIAGAGPRSARFLDSTLSKLDEGAATQLTREAIPGGRHKWHRDTATSAAKQVADAPNLKNTRFAKRAERWQNAKEKTRVPAWYGRGADKSFDLGHKAVEVPLQRQMLGKHLKDTYKTPEAAAKAMRTPEGRALAAREVRRMYGNYNVFSPAMRESMMHWAQFAPWAINAAKFPFMAYKNNPGAVFANTNVVLSTRDEREKQGRAFTGDNPRPWHQVTTIDTPLGPMRAGHYMPMGAWAEILGAKGGPVAFAGNQLLPPLRPLLDASRDYTGKERSTGPFRSSGGAIFDFVSPLTGAGHYVNRATGLGDYISGREVKPLEDRLRSMVDPLSIRIDDTKRDKKKKKGKRKKSVPKSENSWMTEDAVPDAAGGSDNSWMMQ